MIQYILILLATTYYILSLVSSTYVIYAACGDVALSSFSHARLSSYSFGVVDGSEATIVCEEGYRLNMGNEKMTLRCGNQRWYNVITLEDGSERLREHWSVSCYNNTHVS